MRTTTRPVPLDVDRLDEAVEAAIHAGDARGLRVLGYGELTLVLGWPTERPALAVKRLPLFCSGVGLERYGELVGRYIDVLRHRGVGVVHTELRWTGADGELHAYLVQPYVPRDRLLDRVLAGVGAERGARLLGCVARHAAAAVDERVGLDAQVANWAVTDEDDLELLDVSTPLLRDERRTDALDLDVFLSVYPWALRGALARIAHSIMGQYHDPRTVLLDVASNLHKQRLDRWVPALLAAANEHVTPAIDEAEVLRYFKRDRRLWLTMQRLRRADRAWQSRVRRRPYRFLLAPPYAYGPPELPEEEL